jgi:hypothetical protein
MVKRSITTATSEAQGKLALTARILDYEQIGLRTMPR